MAYAVYKSRIDLSDKEKQLLRQAKKKGRKDARLVLRILMIMLADDRWRLTCAAALATSLRDGPRRQA